MNPQYFAYDPTFRSLKGGEFVFGIEKMANVIDEIKPLHALHWNEVEEGHTPLQMDVAYDAYAKFEERGQFVLFTVRTRGFDLVGYLMCYVHRANHAQQNFVAREDAMFLAKEARGTGAANALLDYVEEQLGKMGVTSFVLSSRHYAGGTNLTHWLVGRGFKPSAVVFAKEIKREAP